MLNVLKKNTNVIFYISYFILILTDMMKCLPILEKYSKILVLVSYGLMCIYIGLKVLFIGIKKLKEEIDLKKCGIFALAFCWFAIGYFFSKDTTFIRLAFLIVCMYFIEFNKFVKFDISLKVIILFTTIILNRFGIIPENIGYREDAITKRYSLGFTHPNLLSLYLTTIMFEIFYILKDKYKILTTPFFIGIIIFINYITNTRTSMIILSTVLVFAILYSINKKIFDKIFENKFVKILIYALPIILTAITIICTVLNNIDPNKVIVIDKLFSNRLKWYSVFLEKFNISILGQSIPDTLENVVLDNAYLKILLKFGIITYIIFIIFAILSKKRAYQNKNYVALVLILLLECYGLMETIVIVPTINIFLFYFMCKKSPIQKTENGKFYICEGKPNGDYNASTKARSDVEKILEKQGYKKFFVPTKYGVKENKLLKLLQLLSYVRNKYIWEESLSNLKSGDIVILQYPVLNTVIGLEKVLKKAKKNGIKVIAIIHDLDSLRYKPEYQGKLLCQRVQREDKKVLKACTKIIAHNDKMKEVLVELGNEPEKIIVLELFDYLCDIELKEISRVKDEPIIIAGNLSKEKAGYLKNLKNIKNVNFNLYGIGYEKEENEKNIEYKGAFLPDELLNNLYGSYGLVWDGNSIEECKGGYGEYLKYNNPHKVSMYIATGIPVIIWKEAALADFIQKNKLGCSVSKLDDIEKIMTEMSDTEYNEYLQNARCFSEKIRRGEFLTKAIQKI